VAEQGCKRRGLPKRFGNGYIIYTRMNHWSKLGVLDRVFEQLQLQVVRIRIEAVSLDSTTIIKVHPDGTGALKKRPPGHRQVPRPGGCYRRHVAGLLNSATDFSASEVTES